MSAVSFSSQVIRFGFVGLSSNLILYLFYLGLTGLGLSPKLTMSILYAVGVLQTFVVNKKWTFSHQGYMGIALVRYICVYIAGYLINLMMLMVLVDRLGWHHRWVQLIAVFFVAGFLFMALKFWVFRNAPA